MKVKALDIGLGNLARVLEVLVLLATLMLFTGCSGFSGGGKSSNQTAPASQLYSVNLSWDASGSPDVSGYNIYRAVYTSSCGSFSKINSALTTSTLYTDSVVIDGTSYCYATTAVNTDNGESGYSNIVSNVQIPAP